MNKRAPKRGSVDSHYGDSGKANTIAVVAVALLAVALCVVGLGWNNARLTRFAVEADDIRGSSIIEPREALPEIPEYRGIASVRVNNNVPRFAIRVPFSSLREFTQLDSLGRCGAAVAVVGPETMPDKPRGSIGMVKPSGWHTVRYDWVDGGYLFNRCHLIAYQLIGENDNPLNLITGTRTMNVEGMGPYEDTVAKYVLQTGNHVLYRVTPVFEGENLVASGVLMEALSIEDEGSGVRFCVWCYNKEPGVEIDYATGESAADGTVSDAVVGTIDESGPGAQSNSDASSDEAQSSDVAEITYILNTNTHRFHRPDCPAVQEIKEKNKQPFTGTREEAIAGHYQPCKICNP